MSPTPDGQFRHSVSLDAGDTPRKTNGYAAPLTRCQKKIKEQLDDIDVSDLRLRKSTIWFVSFQIIWRLFFHAIWRGPLSERSDLRWTHLARQTLEGC